MHIYTPKLELGSEGDVLPKSFDCFALRMSGILSGAFLLRMSGFLKHHYFRAR
jgi:hypothetical protein